MNVRGKPRDDVNKGIPQVQPMKDGADLSEYLSLPSLNEECQEKLIYAGTLRPLLNSACFRIISRQPAETQPVFEIFVMEQLTQQLPKTIQQFMRERKPDTPELKTLEHIMTYFSATTANKFLAVCEGEYRGTAWMLGRPHVMKRGKIGHTDHLWCMDSGADMG
jgi:hypothetical protein